MNDEELAKTMANEHELALLDRKASAELREAQVVCFSVVFSISAIMATITACQVWNG